jgi:type VI secretion system protein ImpL
VWEEFLEAFPAGKSRVHGRDEWHALAMRVVESEGPYSSLVDRMTQELNPWKTTTDVPPWVHFLYVRKIGALGASQPLETEEKGFFAKATDKGKTLIDKLERRTRTEGAVEAMKSKLVPAKIHGDYSAYKKALSEIKPAVVSRAQAYETAKQVFNEDPAVGESPFRIAGRALGSLETHLGGNYRSGPFLNLLAEPIKDLWYFVRNEASCQLQELWEKEVLAEMFTDADPKSVNEMLLGPEGYAERFVRGPASPFLSRELGRGYGPSVALNERIPFEPAFLSFMTKGVKSVRTAEKSYRVSVKGLPTDTNAKAGLKPHGTRLEVHCGDQATTLVNLHYPVKETFDWSPETCGDVTFEILVGETTLTKRYTGYHAFPKFLDDFRDGERTFRPDEFPHEEAELKGHGIEYITAKYQFEGHRPVIQLLSEPPGEVPKVISKCWVQ